MNLVFLIESDIFFVALFILHGDTAVSEQEGIEGSTIHARFLNTKEFWTFLPGMKVCHFNLLFFSFFTPIFLSSPSISFSQWLVVFVKSEGEECVCVCVVVMHASHYNADAQQKGKR